MIQGLQDHYGEMTRLVVELFHYFIHSFLIVTRFVSLY
jgi:hypothetical protein